VVVIVGVLTGVPVISSMASLYTLRSCLMAVFILVIIVSYVEFLNIYTRTVVPLHLDIYKNPDGLFLPHLTGVSIACRVYQI
jgi:hypothetical protein